MTQEITDERYGDTLNKWSRETLNEFTEQLQNSLRECKEKEFGPWKITDDFEKNKCRPTNF